MDKAPDIGDAALSSPFSWLYWVEQEIGLERGDDVQ